MEAQRQGFELGTRTCLVRLDSERGGRRLDEAHRHQLRLRFLPARDKGLGKGRGEGRVKALGLLLGGVRVGVGSGLGSCGSGVGMGQG